MYAPINHRGGEMVRARHNVSDDLGVRWVRDGRLEHTDDRSGSRSYRPASQTHRLTEHIWVAMQRGRPEAISQDDDAGRVRPVVLRPDQTAQRRLEPHHVEIGPAYNAGLDCARLTQTDHRETDRREVAKLADAVRAGLDVLQFRHGKIGIGVADARRALPDINQPVFAAV